jgi:uncharacterized protein (DUF302 family)
MKKFIAGLLVSLLCVLNASADPAAAPAIDIARTVIKIPLADDVSPEDAIDSMKLRANVLNFKLVAHQPLSKELEGMGIETTRMEIFQFCDPRIARRMVSHDINFAAYLPCRIAMVEDENQKVWLVMMNLDMFIGSANLPPELEKDAIKVRDSLKEIMQAGASGDL